MRRRKRAKVTKKMTTKAAPFRTSSTSTIPLDNNSYTTLHYYDLVANLTIEEVDAKNGVLGGRQSNLVHLVCAKLQNAI